VAHNKLDKLLVRAHQFRAWLGLPEGVCFNEYLNDYRNEILEKLTKEDDTTRIHRLQGSLEVLDSIIQLRGEMDVYIQGINSGKMRKITKEQIDGRVQ
jgi:hypothetical protein